jgi:hypothetical protein
MRDITLRDPIAKHPLNVGRVAWWLGLPGLTGGPKWFDLMGLSHAAYSVTTPPSLVSAEARLPSRVDLIFLGQS